MSCMSFLFAECEHCKPEGPRVCANFDTVRMSLDAVVNSEVNSVKSDFLCA